MKYLIMLTASLFLLFGCTGRMWYDGVRAGQSINCNKLDGEARDKCLKDANMSYDEYKRSDSATGGEKHD